MINHSQTRCSDLHSTNRLLLVRLWTQFFEKKMHSVNLLLSLQTLCDFTLHEIKVSQLIFYVPSQAVILFLLFHEMKQIKCSPTDVNALKIFSKNNLVFFTAALRLMRINRALSHFLFIFYLF